jgi:hypothetical protein
MQPGTHYNLGTRVGGENGNRDGERQMERSCPLGSIAITGNSCWSMAYSMKHRAASVTSSNDDYCGVQQKPEGSLRLAIGRPDSISALTRCRLTRIAAFLFLTLGDLEPYGS